MAEITVKLFGVLRMDSHIKSEKINAEKVADIFDVLNKRIEEIHGARAERLSALPVPKLLSFKDALIFINGKRCSKAKFKLHDGDEIWLLSPASGG